MISKRLAPAALVLAAASPASGAPPASDMQAAVWAAACATCHGTAGRAVEGSAIPPLAGREAGWIVRQMRDFASGARPATVMHQIAKGYDAGQTARIADWFASQAPEPVAPDASGGRLQGQPAQRREQRP